MSVFYWVNSLFLCSSFCCILTNLSSRYSTNYWSCPAPFFLIYIICLADSNMSIISTLSVSKIVIPSCACAIFFFFLREGFALPLLSLLLLFIGVNDIGVLFWLTSVILGFMLRALCWLSVLIRKSRADLVVLGVSVIVLGASLGICPSLGVWDEMVSGGARPCSLQEQLRISVC